MLQIKEIPVPTGCDHPSPPSTILPKHEFTMGIIAPKGQGKTTLMINFILFYKNFFNKIIIMSPTIKNDPKWEYLKEQDMLVENKPLKELLKRIKENEKLNDKVVQERPIQLTDQDLIKPDGVYEQPFNPKIGEDCWLVEYDESTLRAIMTQQDRMVSLLKKLGYTKYMADRILILFDDMVGSDLFSNAQKNLFKKLNANHRHYSISMIMVTQAYKEIPKMIRTQFSCIILLKIFSEGELKAISEEMPMDMFQKQWFECYNFCTSEQYSFLYFNSQQPLGLRVMKKFDQVVKFKIQDAAIIPENTPTTPERETKKRKKNLSQKC